MASGHLHGAGAVPVDSCGEWQQSKRVRVGTGKLPRQAFVKMKWRPTSTVTRTNSLRVKKHPGTAKHVPFVNVRKVMLHIQTVLHGNHASVNPSVNNCITSSQQMTGIHLAPGNLRPFGWRLPRCEEDSARRCLCRFWGGDLDTCYQALLDARAQRWDTLAAPWPLPWGGFLLFTLQIG